jgi:hypothetical protein
MREALPPRIPRNPVKTATALCQRRVPLKSAWTGWVRACPSHPGAETGSDDGAKDH